MLSSTLSLLDADLVLGILEINFRECHCALEAIEGFVNAGGWVAILDFNSIYVAVVDNWLRFPFSMDKEQWSGSWRL
jgi:hypothetical protein